MRTKTKITILCSAVALLAMGSSMNAMAAQAGWVQEGGTWTYVDSQGNRLTDSWRKSGNYWFYLDSNGEMAVDQWVDDTSYVDINGVRVTNQWIYVEPGTDSAPNPDGG